MIQSKSISVIICAHDAARFERLRQATASVAAQTLPAHEVLLVIDHNPALLDHCRTEFPAVTLLANNGPRGLSGARNTGVLAATGDVIAFLDDDAEAEPQWLAALAKTYRSQFVMGAGGPITAVWPDARPTWLANEFDWVVGCSYRGQALDPASMRNMIGCNMSFRRSALLMTGLFTTGLGRVGKNAAGVEETELCLRARSMFPSAHFAHSEAARVDHHIDAGRGSWRYFFRRCWAEGRSKAALAMSFKSRNSLSSERQHLFVTLPKAVGRYLVQAVTGRDRHGLARAANLLSGTAMVVGGYLIGRTAARLPTAVAFAPLRISDVDTARPAKEITGQSESGDRYGEAFCVVRDNGKLLGVRQIPLYGETLGSVDLLAILDNSSPATEQLTVGARQKARVVIATRDRPHMLANCLDSVLAQDHPNFEVVVVDNAPATEETRDIIAARYAGRVHYLREERPGLANAHNRGLEGLRAGVVAFTDDDVVVDGRWLATLTAPFEESERIGCVTGSIVPAELETRAQYWTELHGGFLKGYERRTFDLADHRPNDPLFPYAVGAVGSGANMAFSGTALRAMGGFDGAMGAGTIARGGDDLAAFLDVLKQGYQIVYVPDALVWHHHRRSESGMERQAHGYGIGLGAHLTRAVVNDPKALLRFLAVAPRGLMHILGAKSDKNARLPGDYPATLLWNERLGILGGIPAYLKSRRSARMTEPLDLDGHMNSAWSSS